MALTLSAAFKTAITRTGAEIRFLVSFDLAAGTFRALNGVSDTIKANDAPASVLSVSPLAFEIDPLTRRLQTGGVTVVVDDAFARPLITNNRFKGRQVQIKIGTRELAEVDYADYFLGSIEEFEPQGASKVRIEVENIMGILEKNKVTGLFLNEFPLTIISDILDLADIPSSLIDADSLDPSKPFAAKISHLVLSRGGSSGIFGHVGVRTPEPALDLIEEVGAHLHGGIIINEDGKFSFKLFDATDPSLADWDEDVILDLKQKSLGDNVINRVLVQWHQRSGVFERRYSDNDTASQANHTLPGQTERILNYDLKSQWLDGTFAFLFTDVTPTQTNILVNQHFTGFSGTRGLCAAGGPPSDARITSARPGFVQIESEIVKVTSMGLTSSGACWSSSWINPNSGLPEVIDDLAMGLSLNVVRGALGTTAVAHLGASVTIEVTDLTVPTFTAERILERFPDGLDIVEVTTSFAEYDKQVGDFVTLTWPEFLSFLRDGITSAVKWEIIGKEADLDASPPLIKWTLAAASTTAFASTGFALDPGGLSDITQTTSRGVEDSDTVVAAVIGGLDVTIISGLNAQVSTGTATSGASQGVLKSNLSFTLDANKDNYISMDTASNQVGVTPVANGATAPKLPGGRVLLGVAITDGAGITSIDETNVQRTTTTGYAKGIGAETSFNDSVVANGDIGLFSRG